MIMTYIFLNSFASIEFRMIILFLKDYLGKHLTCLEVESCVWLSIIGKFPNLSDLLSQDYGSSNGGLGWFIVLNTLFLFDVFKVWQNNFIWQYGNDISWN